MDCVSLLVMRVAIQGQAASYHDQAAHKFFGNNIELVGCHNFRTTFQTLHDKKADYAVLAVENSLYGTINEVYDLLLKSKFWVMGEVYLRVELCLVGMPGTKLPDIKQVHSQAPALAQCEEFLDTKLPQATRFEEEDTAGSAALVKQLGTHSAAAIASEEAAKLYNLAVLKRNIETHHQNFTRFAVLSPTRKIIKGANKTSLVLTTPADTKPGALFHALESFAKRNINLTMLQSRPVLGKAWHYFFYFDVEVGSEDPNFKLALSELNKSGWRTTVLGSYVETKA